MDEGGADASDGDTSAEDASQEPDPADATQDSGAPPADAQDPPVDVGSDAQGAQDTTTTDTAGADTGPADVDDSDTEDTSPPQQDTTPDADQPDPFEGRPTGQCVESADCPQTALGPGMCSRALPGGACLGCGTDDHCPSDTVCQFGACVMECEGLEDCAPGLVCSRGLCRAQRCVDDVCPVPLFGCTDSGQCERSSCGGDEECPEETSCIQGRCIEDRSL